MRVLGLDPGTTKANPTGVALLTGWPSPRLLGTAHLAPERGDSLAEFLGVLSQRLRSDWLNGVDLLAVEWPYVGKNAQSALDLAACCGAAFAVAGERGIRCALVTPSQAKLALAGSGSADKAAMIDAVRVQFGIVVLKDHADAVGIALAASASLEIPQ
jgi:crossover junction endodeoxyribonuclease RuvC